MSKFKVGDEVEVIAVTSPNKGKRGIIFKIDETNKTWPYRVRIGTDMNNVYGEKELRKIANSNNPIVSNALKVINGKVVQVSLRYAGRMQHALQELARAYGVRRLGSDSLVCGDNDEAEQIIDSLVKEYKIPKSEVWVNSTMKNASLKVGDKVRIKLAEHKGKIYTVKEVLQDWRNKNRIAGYILKGPDGEKKRLDLAFLDTLQNSVYSSNPIVQNALKARNADPYLGEKLKLMLAHEAVSVSGGGKPSVDDVVFEHRGKKYYVGKDSAHMVKQFADAGLVKMVNSEWRKKYGV